MADRPLRGKFEARARMLAAERIIPPDKMKLIEAILQNRGLDPEEKYRTVLNLVKTCPMRHVPLPDRKSNEYPSRPHFVPDSMHDEIESMDSTEYINILFRKYRRVKLFRKRFLIHKDTRLGVGIRKRLVPTSKLLHVMNDISEFQNALTSRLNEVSMSLLDDKNIDDPTIFNYLRLIRSWLMITPFARLDYRVVKWMERAGFEREIGSYIKQFYSFLKIDTELRESIILQVENTLRQTSDLKKEEAAVDEDDVSRRKRQKRNLEREQEIYDIILHLRSFLPVNENEDTLLGRMLNERYGIESFSFLMKALIECLVIQKIITAGDMRAYMRVLTPTVHSDSWDYSKEYLKKIGKDPESRKEREIEKLKNELIPFERLNEFLNYGGGPDLFLNTAVTSQWRLIDKNRYDAADMRERNFIVYIESLLQYFRNTLLLFIDGSNLVLKSPERREWDSPIFAEQCFRNRVDRFYALEKTINNFRTSYPTLVLSSGDVKKIMRGIIKSMDHAEHLIHSIGEYFYDLAADLQHFYESHLFWESHGGNNSEDYRMHLTIGMLPDPEYNTETGRPIPFFDCIVDSFQVNTVLNGILKGRRILETQPEGGIFVDLIAFCFQLAAICHSENLHMDFERRKEIISRLRYLHIS